MMSTAREAPGTVPFEEERAPAASAIRIGTWTPFAMVIGGTVTALPPFKVTEGGVCHVQVGKRSPDPICGHTSNVPSGTPFRAYTNVPVTSRKVVADRY
jgi:hypothetical protein